MIRRLMSTKFQFAKIIFLSQFPKLDNGYFVVPFPVSISLIVLISVHLRHLKRIEKHPSFCYISLGSFLQNTYKVTIFVQFSLFKGQFMVSVERNDIRDPKVIDITGFHFVWCCLCGGWWETAVVTPLQSEEQSRSRSRSRSRAPPLTGARATCHRSEACHQPGPSDPIIIIIIIITLRPVLGVQCSLYIQIANERLWRCQIESERRADFSMVI